MAAANILNEGAVTPDHANRLQFANPILANPVNAASFLLPSLMTNATLSAGAGNAPGASGTSFSDSDVDFVVAGVFNQYADQFAAQQNAGAALKLGQ